MSASIDVDHFIPWARHPDNGLDNLVPTHPNCNRAKLDFLAAERHIERWRERTEDVRLVSLAEEQSWDRSADTTVGVARAIYFRLPDGAPLWVEGDTFTPAKRGPLRDLLS
jgi:hypothetical protein